MKPDSEAKIAWVLYHLLEEANDQLWNRYEKEFMRFVAQEDKEGEEEIRTGQRLNEMNPDSPSEPDF